MRPLAPPSTAVLSFAPTKNMVRAAKMVTMVATIDMEIGARAANRDQAKGERGAKHY